MKSLLRRAVWALNRIVGKYACETYGDLAQLHQGPCMRCVGMAVESQVAKESER